MLATHAVNPFAAAGRRPADVSFAVRNHWSKPSVLIVLGMRRSGTSCVRRMLTLMGAHSHAAFTNGVWQEAPWDHGLVACLRHPLSVARSLECRDGLPIADGLRLWHTYNLQLLGHTTAGRQVYWFDFDSGEAGSRRLVYELAADFPLEPSAAALSHYRESARHHWDDARVPGQVGDLYEVLCHRAHAGD